MAEQFTVNGSFWNCTAVDGYVWMLFAGTELVDDVGKELLSDTAFTLYQDGDVHLRNLTCDFNCMIQRRRVADDTELFFNCLYVFHCGLLSYDSNGRRLFDCTLSDGCTEFFAVQVDKLGHGLLNLFIGQCLVIIAQEISDSVGFFADSHRNALIHVKQIH